MYRGRNGAQLVDDVERDERIQHGGNVKANEAAQNYDARNERERTEESQEQARSLRMNPAAQKKRYQERRRQRHFEDLRFGKRPRSVRRNEAGVAPCPHENRDESDKNNKPQEDPPDLALEIRSEGG